MLIHKVHTQNERYDRIVTTKSYLGEIPQPHDSLYDMLEEMRLAGMVTSAREAKYKQSIRKLSDIKTQQRRVRVAARRAEATI